MKQALRRLKKIDGDRPMTLVKTSDVSWDGHDYEAEVGRIPLIGFSADHPAGPILVTFSPETAGFGIDLEELERTIQEARRADRNRSSDLDRGLLIRT